MSVIDESKEDAYRTGLHANYPNSLNIPHLEQNSKTNRGDYISKSTIYTG